MGLCKRLNHTLGTIFSAILFLSSPLTILSLPIQQVSAQSQEHLHQQRQDGKSQTHASVTEADKKPFLESLAPPEIISTFGPLIDWLFRYTSFVGFLFFLTMAGALVYFVFAFRERPGHKPFYTKGTDRKSVFVTGGLVLLVFISLDIVLLIGSFIFTTRYYWVDTPQGPDVVKVQVMPQQWMWNFRYPGLDGSFGTEDDIVSNHLMKVPKGRPIVIQMKSKDVIHGFTIPNIKLQMDAIPGSVTKFWFDAHKTGEYEIVCMHLCGAAHYKMKGFLSVVEPEDYETWAKEASEWSKNVYDPADKQTHWGWAWGPDTVVKKGFSYGLYMRLGDFFLSKSEDAVKKGTY